MCMSKKKFVLLIVLKIRKFIDLVKYSVNFAFLIVVGQILEFSKNNNYIALRIMYGWNFK